MLQLELAALEALGQALADGLLDDAGACKTDECARLGQHDVAKAGKAGGNAAGRGVGQHTDVQPAPGRKALDGGAGLGHLHQAENALLHPGAAAGRKDDQRQFFAAAYSMARVIFSPTAVLMLPIKKRLSSTAATTDTPPMRPTAATAASLRPVFWSGR